MIPCHDLRTGNIILVNRRLRKVTMISNSQTLTDQSLVGVENNNYDENENYSVEDIQPVPLNEAVLQQCHFTYQQYFKFWQLISTDAERTEMDITADDNFIVSMRRPIMKNVASLHHLQNICYMLFNKELDFDVETTIVVDGVVRSQVSTN